MKNIIILLLMISISILINSSGYETTNNFIYFDIKNNLMYKSVHLIEKNNKINDSIVTNIIIYDFSKRAFKKLFDSNFSQTIDEIYFEVMYDNNLKKIKFNKKNQYDEYYDPNIVENNFDLKERDISDNLIVFTESEKNKTKSIWISDKFGNNLKKIFEYKLIENIEINIDARNKKIIILNYLNNDIKIDIFDY